MPVNDERTRYERPCLACAGLGALVHGDTVKFCPECDGSGIDTEPEVYELTIDELVTALTEHLHEAPPFPCEKCNVDTMISFERTLLGLEIIATCPKCGETFIVLEFLQRIGGASLN